MDTLLKKLKKEMSREIKQILDERCLQGEKNFDWLQVNLNPYFFITMAGEHDALANLVSGLHTVAHNRRLVVADQKHQLIQASLSYPGSLHQSFMQLQEKKISYAEVCHSYRPVSGTDKPLEIQRFEFDRKSHQEIGTAGRVRIPRKFKEAVTQVMPHSYAEFAFCDFDQIFRLLWLNNEKYIRISPAERVARIIWLYQQVCKHNGLYLDVENTVDVTRHQESRLLFAVGNPPECGFLAQIMEIFNRLDIGVQRAYTLNISNGTTPYFLGTFYIATRKGELIMKDSALYNDLKAELYNTQILANTGRMYSDFLINGVVTGAEASLNNAIIAFCHTNLAHNRPDLYDLGEIKRAFYQHPEVMLRLSQLFFLRFQPGVDDREQQYQEAYEDLEQEIQGFNTGHRHLDEYRQIIYSTALLLIHYTLKTNFFVPEKHALAFRLDPAYLEKMSVEFTSDLPAGKPFRVTYFYGRYGAGYHVGFSDIARGGWRTIICRTSDDFLTNASTLFREVFVLAHTQHLKNKDIYEGGSKMGVVLDVSDIDDRDLITQRLYKLQYGFLNAFLDIFITENGRVKHPNIIDYYGEDEPIELGPDENMHDSMIELIAKQSVKRGYLLGPGLISSKEVGINHKQYGVTSLGVTAFAEITMEELGVDMCRDSFSVKITGGPNGDVAGNCMRLLLERCPQVKIKLVVAGSGVAYDPQGLNHQELGRLVLKANINDFDPEYLSPGGFILFRKVTRREGLVELFRKLMRTENGVEELWITSDEFHRDFDGLIFSVPADLFIPAGGRPETIDEQNWSRLFSADWKPSCRAIVEGANSFITPAARLEIQQHGVVVIRDAAANKCGVISSSYEIIANLLLSEKEFLTHKDAYVADVLGILERRARDEARLIFRRYREAEGTSPYTEIANGISTEINTHYNELFNYFQSHPELVQHNRFRPVLLAHLPAFISGNRKYRLRLKRLPPKYRYAMLASELASTIVYQGGWEVDFGSSLKDYVKKHFSA